jgi:hypothetical protein
MHVWFLVCEQILAFLPNLLDQIFCSVLASPSYFCLGVGRTKLWESPHSVLRPCSLALVITSLVHLTTQSIVLGKKYLPISVKSVLPGDSFFQLGWSLSYASWCKSMECILIWNYLISMFHKIMSLEDK